MSRYKFRMLQRFIRGTFQWSTTSLGSIFIYSINPGDWIRCYTESILQELTCVLIQETSTAYSQDKNTTQDRSFRPFTISICRKHFHVDLQTTLVQCPSKIQRENFIFSISSYLFHRQPVQTCSRWTTLYIYDVSKVYCLRLQVKWKSICTII
jgi:hypothetical protein